MSGECNQFRVRLLPQPAALWPLFRIMLQYCIMHLPAGRLGRPEEVANVAMFLASPAANWVTAQVIGVSGGQGFGR